MLLTKKRILIIIIIIRVPQDVLQSFFHESIHANLFLQILLGGVLLISKLQYFFLHLMNPLYYNLTLALQIPDF